MSWPYSDHLSSSDSWKQIRQGERNFPLTHILREEACPLVKNVYNLERQIMESEQDEQYLQMSVPSLRRGFASLALNLLCSEPYLTLFLQVSWGWRDEAMCTHSPEAELHLSNIGLPFQASAGWESYIYGAEWWDSCPREDQKSLCLFQMPYVKWWLTYLSTRRLQISAYKLMTLTQITCSKYLKNSMPHFYFLSGNKLIRLQFILGWAGESISEIWWHSLNILSFAIIFSWKGKNLNAP